MASLSRQILLQALESSTDDLLILDARRAHLPIVFSSTPTLATEEYFSEDYRGQSWPMLDGDDEARAVLNDAIEQGRTASVTIDPCRSGSSAAALRVRAYPLKSRRGRTDYLLLKIDKAADETVDIGSLKRQLGEAQEGLGRLERVDPRSGLLRYERFKETLARDLSLARRERKALCAIVFEVVELDVYQSTYGKNAADSCIRMIGKQVQRVLQRASDLCGQLNESTIVTSIFGQDEQAAKALSNRICANIEGLRLHNPHANSCRFVTVEARIVPVDPQTDDIESWTQRLESTAKQRVASGSA